MAEASYSPLALTDLSDIWQYSAETWGERQANRYIRSLHAAAKRLAKRPLTGQSIDWLRKGYRKHPAGSHIMFYRQIKGGIEVVRILHQRMDVARHL